MSIQIAITPLLTVIHLHAYIWLVQTIIWLLYIFFFFFLEYLANEEGPTELDKIEEELKLLEQKEKDLIQTKKQCLTTQITDKGMCLHYKFH